MSHPRTLASDLTALRNELRLGATELEGLLTKQARFGGRTLDRVYERLSSADWHPDLENVVHRITTAGAKVFMAKTLLAIVRNPLQDPEVLAAMQEAFEFLDAFALEVDLWRDEIKAHRIPSMPRSSRARAFVDPNPARGRLN